MIPTQTLESYPVFGDNATKVQPDNVKYANGFIEGDVYPAEWVNWAWAKNTQGITDANAGIDSMEKEINSVLTGAGKTPDVTQNNQLLLSIQKLIKDAKDEAILAAHPVGSLYWSSQSTDPATLFGGTWTPIKDCFVWAKGDADTVNATGGSKTVTLTTNNLPAHTHSVGAHSHGLNSHTHSLNSHTHTLTHTHTINNGNTSSSGTVTTVGFRGTQITTGASSAANTGNTQPTFTGSAVTSGANNRGHTHSYAHTHGYTPSGTISEGTITIERTDRAKVTGSLSFVVVTSGSGCVGTGQNTTTNALKIAPTFTGTAGSTTSQSTSTSGDASQTHTHSVTASGTVQNHSHTMAHTHNATATGYLYGETDGASATTTSEASGNTGVASGSTANSTAFDSGSTGSGTAVTVQNPYIVKYCWERTA